MSSLEKKTTVALSWSGLETLLNQGLTIGIRIILARMIDPTEFGLLALLTIVITLCEIVIQSGFGQAIIQKKEISQLDVSTVFFFNFVCSLVFYLVLFFTAPLVAQFYEEPRLTLLLRVVALSIVIRSLGRIHYSLLVRNLQFKKLVKITLPSLVAGGVVGIVMAFLEFEVWAIVAFQMVTAVVASLSYWKFSELEDRPQWEFSWKSLSGLWKFSSGVFGASFIHCFVTNLYGLLIGKAFSFGQLAFYNQARTFHQSPASIFTSLVTRVLFPVFSSIQDDNAKIIAAMKRGIPVMAFIVFPVMGFLMIASENLVVFLLTEKWLPTARLMCWFPLVGMFMPLSAIQNNVIKAKGRTGLFFWGGLAKSALAVGVLILTIEYGILAVVIGQVVVAAVSLLVNLAMTQYVIGYRIDMMLFDFLPYGFWVAIAGVTSILVVNLAGIESHFASLILKFVMFGSVYYLLCRISGLAGPAECSEKIADIAIGLKRFNTPLGNQAKQ